MPRHSVYRTKLASTRLGRLMRMAREHLRRADKATLAKNAILGLGALFLFGCLVFLGAYAWFSRDLPDPNTLLTRDIALSTKIYDRTGEHLLYEIAGDKKRTLITLDQLPENLKNAVIAAEDANFYSHHGISLKGLGRAVIFRGNRGGGSTITQQLVKNAILTNERRLTRKFKEIILSLAIERNFTKDQILQMYFNEIGYGGRNYGVETAAQDYYGKSASELTLSESATLAGLPQLPTMYLNNLDRLKVRRDWILGRMVTLGYITQADADAAIAEEITISADVGTNVAPHFVLWVKEQLVELYGERMVEETGGLTVITTLDYDKQRFAEEAVTNGVNEPCNTTLPCGETYNFNNAGLLAMDPKTGQVLAMVGSVEYGNDDIQGQVNVTMRPLQPGSSFKPIVYAAAFEKGYTPNTILWDVDTVFPTATGPYEPHNYDLGERGPLTMRKALQGSLNTPAVKTLYLTGLDRALDFAERLGYTSFTDRSKFGLAVVLGGAEVELLEHARAYSVFANQGKRQDITAILKVTDANKNVLLEWKEDEHQGEQVIDAAVAATITNVISDNAARAYVFGPASALQLGSRPVAAKTGTTNDYNDAWTMGYTPSLVAGVWVGNTNGAEMKRGADGSIVAAPIWNAFMRQSLEGTPIEAFPAVEIPVTGKPVLDGELSTQTITIDTASGKLATERTPDRFRKEMTCGEYHEILHYVSKDEPRGDAPSDPAADSYYDDWESAVQAWIAEQNSKVTDGTVPYESCTIPTEEDDVHVERNEPELALRNPDNNDDVGRTFEVQYSVETRRDFSRVEFAIDGTYVTTSLDNDEHRLTLPSWVRQGEHILSATVYDDVDNAASDDVTINVTEGPTALNSVRISNPFTNQTIEKTDVSYMMSVEIPDAVDARTLTVFAQNLWTHETSIVSEVAAPSAISSIAWTLPSEAEYALWARVSYDDSEADSESVRVFVRDVEHADTVTSIVDLELTP